MKNSLKRLGVESVELYQVHGYIHLTSIEHVAKGLAQCVKLGLAKTVGVSNYSKEHMIRMYDGRLWEESSAARFHLPRIKTLARQFTPLVAR